jgi:hypothetical protein
MRETIFSAHFAPLLRNAKCLHAEVPAFGHAGMREKALFT